ncbi:Glycoside hydrolase, superfamily [Kalmanozyma brasiliensis GHG001]|uniref:Beta-glucuronidase C-terminal domain-containing protein n=1 Tax=Kalmanozyma brasiliensis (strain GHG001) TaxID=1365824 RepID=V5E9B5_KALBG|nr:Glycoside hydrolase, superfamily [Kalmanozyma brasiliensis GHG001]EST06946.1 Glycoside hydrolase, superfamily [Kalmanozyma brasiliensis GHG001]
MPSSLTSALVALFASALAIAPTTLAQATLNPAASVANAGSVVSNTINPSFAGFGIEPTDLYVFTGTTSPNQLTFNLLSNLANYTGAPPHIRIGGNAGDTMLFDSSVTSYTFQQNPNPVGQGNARPSDYYLFGPNYFRVMDYFPAGTPVTYGLNLAYQGSDALERIVEQAAAAFDYIGTDDNNGAKLYSLEIGNEPDLYIDLGYRSQSWSPTDFGNEWASRAEAVYNQTLKSRGIASNFFEVAATATTASKNGQPFRIANLVGNTQGVAADNGIYVAGWNQHDYFYYIGVSPFNLTLSYLLDLSQTVSQFREWAGQVGQAQVTGKPYYLREMGSVGPNGLPGISETFGNALWTFNFFFYAASIQVDSVQMHITQYSQAAPWQNTYMNGMGPHVRPTYYAWAAWAQIVGPTCNTRIAPISIGNQPSSYNNRLGAYAVYRGTTLTSVVMINTQLYYSYTGNPSYQNFALSLPSLAGQTVYVSTMYADGVDSTSNVQWNGISYEPSNAGGQPTGQPRTVNSTQATMTVGSDGSLTVPVRDSQVVVISTVQLGRESVNTQNCQNLASTGTSGGGGGTSTGSGGGSAAPTFKSTTGFKSDMPLSMTAIIAIAAGGGAFLLILLGLFIWCCVRSCRKSKARKARNAALMKPPARHDDHPLLDSNHPDDSNVSYPAYQRSPAARHGWDSPMTSNSHNHQVHPSQSYAQMTPAFDYQPVSYQYNYQSQSYGHAPPTHSVPPQPMHHQYLQNPYAHPPPGSAYGRAQ